jgi:hypothetical protein
LIARQGMEILPNRKLPLKFVWFSMADTRFGKCDLPLRTSRLRGSVLNLNVAKA